MLQAIRGRAASWVVKILFVLLIISFGAWGIADYVNGSAVPRYVARVGDVKIDPQALSIAINSETQRLRQIFGNNIDRDQAKAFGLVDRALDGLIAQSVLEQQARRLGVGVSDEAVRISIQSDPTFRNQQGQFDIARFRQLLAGAGYSEERFVQEMRRDLLRSQVTRPVAENAHVPDALKDLLLTYRLERRAAATIAVPLPDAESIAAPTDQELADYHQANAARFTAPEFRGLSYILLSPAAVDGGISVTDAQLEESYKARVDELATPETRTVEQMLLADETAAKAAREKIAAGADFLTVAKEDASIEPDQAKLGTFARSQLPADFADPVFALQQGAVSEPVRSGFGWHLFRVTAIEPGKTPTFDEVKDTLRGDLIHEKAQDAVFDLSNKLDDMLGTNTPLEEAAQRMGLKVEKLAETDRNGRSRDGTVLPAVSPQLLSTAFALQSGETSRLVEASADSFFVVRADSITPPALKPLADIREEVVGAWVTSKREAAAKARADAMLEEIKGGKPIAEVAAAQGLAVETTEPFTREGAGASLPANVVSALFAGTVGTAAAGSRNDGQVVAQLERIVPVEATALPERRASIDSELRNAVSSDLLQAFQTALRQKIPVEIDRKAIDTLF